VLLGELCLPAVWLLPGTTSPPKHLRPPCNVQTAQSAPKPMPKPAGFTDKAHKTSGAQMPTFDADGRAVFTC